MGMLKGAAGGVIFALVMATNSVLAADLPSDVFNQNDINITAPIEPDRGGEWAATIYGGFASENRFSKILLTPWEAELETDTPWIGGSLSKRIGTWGKSIAFELEGGAGYRFGDEDTGEVWGALYVRYDNFFWNDTVYTTLAASTGLNYASRISPIERDKNDGDGSKLLHFFAPEVTFARPEDKNTELVFRLHHRSGVFGLFNGVSSGTNIPTIGLRKRF